MKLAPIAAALASLAFAGITHAASPIDGFQKAWTHTHTGGVTAEISAFDAATGTVWVAGVVGVDVLNATTGALVQHIDTRAFGAINSVAIRNGLAAFAMESTVDRTAPGEVVLFDTTTRSLAAGTNRITVGALPDMVTFTPDGSRLLVANEATPSTYGARIGTSVPRVFANAVNDPAGSVSVIDMGSRSVIATAGFAGVAQTGSHLRLNTGMDFEPEYIAVNSTGTKAFVSVQEANGLAVLDLGTNQFEKVVGLGAKDFNAPGNEIDSLNNSTVSFANVAAKGLYMPDAVATYQAGGRTFVVMANEGDFREDNGDRSAASGLGATGLLANLRVSNTDSSPGDLFVAGGRSFSIRDTDGNLVYDSGSILDREAARLGIYDDDRSRDKGVEPEGVEILSVDGRTLAFIGLERTTTAAVAVFDVTDPNAVSYLDMIVTDGDVAPEGLEAFTVGGRHFLAISNEVSNTTSVYNLAAVPEPSTWAMLGAGLGLLGFAARRRRA